MFAIPLREAPPLPLALKFCFKLLRDELFQSLTCRGSHAGVAAVGPEVAMVVHDAVHVRARPAAWSREAMPGSHGKSLESPEY